ncbi:MAG: hypothetical protein WDW38_010027 [Sanguina aurantia]
MPAPRNAAREPTIVEQLDQQARKKAVNQGLNIDVYFRAADLLIQQANAYRSQRNDEQLYVMLMRYASLICETMKDHNSFREGDPRFARLRKIASSIVMPELEQLKPALNLKHISEPRARSINRPANVVQISVSDMPQLNWGTSAPPPLPSNSHPTSLYTSPGLADDLLDFVNNRGQASLPSPPSSSFSFTSQPAFSQSSSLNPDRGSASFPSSSQPQSNSLNQLTSFPEPAPSKYTASDRATSEKHLLFGSSSSSSSERSSSSAPAPSAPAYPRYPELMRPPPPPSSATASHQQSGDPFANQQNPGSNVHGLDQNMQQLSLSMNPPSAGPSLGPQQLQVLNVPSSQGFHSHSGTCSSPPPAPSAALDTGGVKELNKLAQLRDVHVSVALMEEFLAYAASNTKRGIESCGILAGRLQANDSIFNITTLIIPKQSGTSDTVQALNEEEIFDVQFKQELYPLGWVHTHPTQTCFLSSIDVHTHCGYQTMLDEAVAIVMAPTDRSKRIGIFRLTTPGGLGLVQRCTLRGFHTHPVPDTGQEIYDLCGHVFLNPQAKHEVIDLR